MKRFLFVMTGVAAIVASTRSHAQSIDSRCPAGTAAQRAAQDACQKALDLFTVISPQLGMAIVGGNAVAGEHSTLGGLGHVSVGVRANVLRARVPQIQTPLPLTTGAVQTTYAVKDVVVPVPVLDAAIGLFKGIPVGAGYILGIDGLVNVSYLPEVSESDLTVTLPDGSVKLGFGARVAVLEESIITPGIVVTYLRRDLPRVSVVAEPGGDEIRVDDIDVATTAWRAVIGKRLGFVGVSVGAGQDKLETAATARVSGTRVGQLYSAGPIRAAQDLTRDNYFANLSLNFPLVRLVAEVGRASGGTLATYNAFGTTRADDALDYASLAIRFRW